MMRGRLLIGWLVDSKHCGKRLLAFVAEVHVHEYHSGSVSNDADDGIVDRMKEEASI